APNVAPLIATQAATQFAVAILAEAGLSYVGLGAQPPAVSWGRMLAEAQTLVALAPQLALWPGLAIAASVFAVTAFGEALRARLDPREARR
ncbi:MAG: ABC transporter permease subunit, partial [Pseudomonadota bacterium]